MKRATVLMTATLLFLAFGAAGVQADEHTDEPEILAQTYHVKLLPGHGLEFETAYKKHLEMHRAADDPQEFHTWEVIVGKNVGSFYIRTNSLTWARMDEGIEIPDDREDLMETVSPHIKSVSGMVSEMMPKVSNWPADYGIPKMVEVTMFTLDYDHLDDFFYGMNKIHEMIAEHEIPYTYAWNKVVVGGQGAQLYLSMPRGSWSEFKEPSPSLWEVAAEAMGKRESEDLRKRIGAAIESEESFVVVHRPDLSYVPK
jgi:hypothetical protein